MSWILLTFLTALIEAIASIFDRFVIKNEVKNTDTMAMLWGYASAIMFTLPAIITGDISLNKWSLTIGLIGGFFYICGWHFFYKAINKTEASRIAPFMATIPLFVLIGSTVFLHEYNLPLQYLGMGLILVGVLMHTYDRKTHHLINHQVIIWAVIASAFFASKNLLVKYLSLLNFSPLNILFWLGLSILFFNLIFSLKVIKNPRVKNQRAWGDLSLAAVLEASSALLFTAAITIGPTSIVSFLSRIAIFFVFIFSEILDYFRPNILHEKFNKADFFQKLIGVSIVLLGSYFLI